MGYILWLYKIQYPAGRFCPEGLVPVNLHDVFIHIRKGRAPVILMHKTLLIGA